MLLTCSQKFELIVCGHLHIQGVPKVSSHFGPLKNGKMNLCMSTGSRENKQNEVRTQLWEPCNYKYIITVLYAIASA